jgi:hypothetical protein
VGSAWAFPQERSGEGGGMNEIQSDIDLLWTVNSADIDALEDARMTLQSIKEADPGTYDEIIDQSLSLIIKALSMTPGGAIERIVEKLNVTEETLK